MSAVRQCDACGSIGVAPYDGWLNVTSYAQEDDEDGGSSRLFGPSRHALLKFDVCSHACLPELALKRVEEFMQAVPV